ISPCVKMLAAGFQDRSVRVFDVRSGSRLWQRREHSDFVRALAWSPDGATLASGAHDRTVRFWGADGVPLRTVKALQGRVLVLAWSPDGQRLAVAGDNWSVPLLDPVAGQARVLLQGHRDRVRALAWFADGRSLVTAS